MNKIEKLTRDRELFCVKIIIFPLPIERENEWHKD